MLNCLSQLKFSESKSANRREKACSIVGEVATNRVIAYALFLLGANRDDIGKFLSIPKGTLLCFFTRFSKNGLFAFSDGRRKNGDAIPEQVESGNVSCGIEMSNGDLCMEFGSTRTVLHIPDTDELRRKVVLLTFLESGLVSCGEVARALGISVRHVGNLLRKFKDKGASSLLDQRQGQRHDYVYTPELKSELILQFVVNASEGKKTSGQAIVSAIQERKQIVLSDRSVRHHVSRLGLNMIAGKITETVSSQKKTRRSNYECRK